MYSYEANVVFGGIAHMRVIGWEEDDYSKLTDGEGRDLAGNAFSIPNAALVSACCCEPVCTMVDAVPHFVKQVAFMCCVTVFILVALVIFYAQRGGLVSPDATIG